MVAWGQSFQGSKGGREVRAEAVQGPHGHIPEGPTAFTREASWSGLTWEGRTRKKVQQKKQNQHKGYNKGLIARSWRRHL